MKAVLINGQSQDVTANTLSELIQELDISTSYVALALNASVIPSSEFQNTVLQNGDKLEIIAPVAGG